MKKLSVLAIIFFCLPFLNAIGESLPDHAVIYEHPNDPMNVYSFTPLEDGSIVLAGQLRHHGQYRDMPENTGYEFKELEILNDAAAVYLAPDGTKRWEIRLADPQAENMFYCQGLLPDGRLLMTFRAYDSKSFGSHHFIVSLDGVVEEMLPTKKISETTSPIGLTLMSEGFLSDGSRYVDDIYGTEYPTIIIMRDFELNELWRYDYSSDSTIGYIGSITERPDGYIIGGYGEERNDGNPASFILKLNRNGELLWQSTEIPIGYDLCSPCFPEDGGMIFSGIDSPGHSSLIKLDDNGKLVWSIPIDEVRVISGATALGDGYVLTGNVSEDTMVHEYLLLYVDSEGKTIGSLPITGDGNLVPQWPELLKDESGNIFVYANLAEPDNVETRWSGDVKKFFYAKIDEDSFR